VAIGDVLPPSDAAPDAEPLQTDTGTEKPPQRRTDGTLTSEGAREAAKQRWARERARERTATADVAGEDLVAIVNALKDKAKKGDVAASRELREWLRQAQDQGPTQVDVLQALSPEQRAIVRDWLSQSRPQ
jgi:hypothetical protein